MSWYLQQYIGVKIMNPERVAQIEQWGIGEAKKPNPLVIYHGNCVDGFSAAWVFYHVSKQVDSDLGKFCDFDFHAGVYNETPPDVSERVVYLVDFSYKRNVVRDMILIGGAKSVILIDHHKTAIEDLSGLSEEILEEHKIAMAEIGDTLTDADEYEKPDFQMFTDMEMSGATLAWKYWVEQGVLSLSERPLLLGHIEDRDLWKFKLPLTREIQANVFSYEYTFENWDKLMASDQRGLIQLAEGGMSIERKHHKDIAELVKVCQRFIDFNSFYSPEMEKLIPRHVEIPIASLPYTLTSDAGHLMAKNYEDGKWFAMCYWDTADHRIFSLRSTENGIDVSEVAKLYNGGGHKHAAGFKVDRNHWLASV